MRRNAMEVKTQLSKIGQELEMMMNKVRSGVVWYNFELQNSISRMDYSDVCKGAKREIYVMIVMTVVRGFSKDMSSQGGHDGVTCLLVSLLICFTFSPRSFLIWEPLWVDNLDAGHDWRCGAVPWAAQQAAPPQPLPHDHLQAQPDAGEQPPPLESFQCAFLCRCTAGQRVTWSRTWTRSSLPGRRSCAWSTWRCWRRSTRIWSDSTSTLPQPTLSFTFLCCRWDG